MKIIEGDILNSQEEYIVQQCNCLTITSSGLSKTLADKWSWADPYSKRRRIGSRNLAIEEDRDAPGTIRILSSNDKNVICMFAQWAPGKCQKYKSYPSYEIDTYPNRKIWFQKCLDLIADIDGIKSIAFPYKIGCGLAGGNWNDYYEMLEEFDKNTSIEVVIYKI